MEFLNESFSKLHPLVPGIILAILLVLFLFFSVKALRQLIMHWRLHFLIDKLGQASLKNVYIPDGLGEYIYIEQLILQADGLLFLTVKPFRGNIFAAEHIDQWTQVTGNHSYKFANPLHQQEADLQALRGMVNKEKVSAMVVFAKGSQFPKGKPDGVCDYQELKLLGQEAKAEINPDLKAVWDELNSQAEPASNMKQKIFMNDSDRRSLYLGLVIFGCAMAYAAWYVQYLTL